MFKEIIQDLLRENNLSRKSFSDQSGIPYQTVCGWINFNRLPDYTTLIKVADYFQCSLDYLVGRQDEFGNAAYERKRPTDEQNLLNNYRGLSENNKELVSKLLDSLKN